MALIIPTSASVSAADTDRPFGLKTREPWTTSRVVGTPEPPPPYAVKRVFPQLTFDHPLYIAQEPGSERLMVGERSGKIYAFSPHKPEPEARELFLDIGREVYAFSFHPDYQRNGHVFVFSPRDPKDKSDDKQSRVSRFRAAGQPRTCANDTERIIIEWPAGGHNGGEALIGPDGFLYISTGDGTSSSDQNATGQGVNDLFSVILRIDVDHPSDGQSYSIPQDNPFVNFPGARGEVWAHGFRNPWRMSFDAKTGDLWVGDVGQDLWEMIWRVRRGGNYGWSVQEGNHPFHPHKKLGPGPILPPVVEHHHTECRSITGGYVYYGTKLPELNGVYFYGDYEYGKIWGVRYDGERVTWHQELADTSLRIPSFGVDRDGTIYLMDHLSGELYEMVRAPAATANARFPRKLSETGLFASVKDHQPTAGVVAYSVNAPQWIDGAVKQRFFALPEMSQLKFVEKSGNASTWGFEDGSVTFETISMEMQAGNPASLRRIETRMMVKQQNHWLGYSYVWNQQQTDAELVDAQGKSLPLMIQDPRAPGGMRRQTWRIPSRNECMVCHSRAAAFVLGLRTVQMNGNHDYQGTVDNQLRALDHVGYFTKPLKKEPGEYNALANPYDATADLDGRARAYLHVNCAVCHVASGGGNARISLLYSQDIKDTKLLNEAPIHGNFGLADARIVSPGDPFASVLFYRLAKVGRGRMPHVGSNLTDQRGLDLIYDWIADLESQEASSTQSDPGRQTQDAAVLESLRATADAAAPEREKQIERLLDSTRSAFIVAQRLPKLTLQDPARQAAIAQGVASADTDIRDLFERFIPEEQRTQRLGLQIEPELIRARTGNIEAGRKFFFSATAAQCKNCHRINDHGGSLGPDLSQIGKKYKWHELLESLVQPSRKIDEKFATYLLVTKQGKVLTGLLVERTDAHTILNVMQDGQPTIVRVPADDIDEFLRQNQSLMPDRLLRDLTPQQAADLLAFLASLK